jgi:hypothetical protein
LPQDAFHYYPLPIQAGQVPPQVPLRQQPQRLPVMLKCLLLPQLLQGQAPGAV